MKNFSQSIFLTILLCMLGAKSFAHDIEVKNAQGVTIYYNYINDGTELAVTYRGTSYNSYIDEYTGEVIIPEEVTYNSKTLKVTSIGNRVFRDCSGLTSVTIGNSVTSIGSQAFSDCTGLTSVTIPNSVTSIEDIAFYGCSGLTSVTIPNSVTSIGDNAFRNCSGLTSVAIGSGVTSIGMAPFYDCSGLTKVTLNSNALASKSYSSSSTLENIFGSQVKEFILGNEVTSIGSCAFHYCDGLTSITIPNSVTSIGDNAFRNCSGLTSVTIPKSVTSIGNSVFENCYKLTSVTIPNSVTSIGDGAFGGCSGLTSITIPNSVMSIEGGAFNGCSGLTSITIPNSVTSIGNGAFNGCSGLTSVTIGNSVTSIGSQAFYVCRSLTSVTIPNSVTSIGDRAFSGCSGLTSVTIGNSVTSIGNSAFYYCSSLKSVKSDISVPFTFGSGAFSGISSNCVLAVPYGTKDAYITKGWTTSVFKGGIKEMTYVVDGIYYGFNSNNKQATVIASENKYSGNVIIPSSVTYNGETYSVTSIGGWAFSDCTGLTSVTIPNSVTSIGGSAFYGCSGLTTLIIPNSVTSIGDCAFDQCSGLTSVTIPNSVTSIGNYAFSGCSGLTSVYSYIENPTSSTGSNFDSSNYSNATLYVPLGTKDKYLATDGWKKFANIVEMPQEIEPIEEETVIAFNDKDYIVDNTPVDLNSTIINNIYISMDNKSDVNNPDGFYNSTDKCIVINKATSASAIETAIASDLSSSDFINNYTGIVIEVNGKGSVTINAQTIGNNKLAVKTGSDDANTYTLASKGDVTINYDVTENTYVYIYAVDADNQQQSLSMDITDTSDNAVKVYSVTVTPDVTAIETVASTIPAVIFGKVYSIDGKQLAQPQKGLNILKMSDGTTRKVVK